MKQSIINWQTGEPKESGSYLVVLKDGKVYSDYFSTNSVLGKNWNVFSKTYITAWCKLSDIKPYKEE